MTANKHASSSAISQLRDAAAKPNAISIEPRYSGLRVYAYGPVVVSSVFFVT